MTRSRLTRSQRLHYRLDNAFSSGTSALVAWLGAAAIGLVLVAAIVAAIVGIRVEGSEMGFLEALWTNLIRTLDPGTLADDTGWTFRILSLVVTLGGVLVVSSFIGLLATGISERVLELQRGRSPVAEEDFVLVLGWSPKVPTIVGELFEAAEPHGRERVVILAPRPKEEMERELRSRHTRARGMRWICRSGSSFDLDDLRLVHPDLARAIVAFSHGGDGDAEMIKTVLALLHNFEIAPDVPFVVEVVDHATAPALAGATGGRVIRVESSEIVARITAQVARQPGLSTVYLDLLTFAGDECYLHEEPSLAGRPFCEALFAYETCSVLGVARGDGSIRLAPDPSTVLDAGDRLVILARDRSAIELGASAREGKVSVPTAPATARREPDRRPEHVLLVGWSSLAPLVLRELDQYVEEGSTVTVWLDAQPERAEDVRAAVTGLDRLRSTGIETGRVDVGRAATVLERDAIDHVVILCTREPGWESAADAHALLTMLQVRNAVAASERTINVVTELLDARDADLAPPDGADDFIVSEHLVSLLMGQITGHPLLHAVFADLFDPEGAELYLQPVARYVTGPTGPVPFRALVAAAAARGGVAIGYRPGGASARNPVVLNPAKAHAFEVGPDDQILVLAEHEHAGSWSRPSSRGVVL